MSENSSFPDFLWRLRAGDEQAAAELVQRYERVIRCEARLRLTDPKLGRLLDSGDICQSVLASFFVRAAAGQYDLHQPRDLKVLLVRMAHNKVASQARRQRARAAEVRTVGRTTRCKVHASGPTSVFFLGTARLAGPRGSASSTPNGASLFDRRVAVHVTSASFGLPPLVPRPEPA
jgi:DNA-directed RNA polymerase specialized sigma24 family protein